MTGDTASWRLIRKEDSPSDTSPRPFDFWKCICNRLLRKRLLQKSQSGRQITSVRRIEKEIHDHLAGGFAFSPFLGQCQPMQMTESVGKCQTRWLAKMLILTFKRKHQDSSTESKIRKPTGGPMRLFHMLQSRICCAGSLLGGSAHAHGPSQTQLPVLGAPLRV